MQKTSGTNITLDSSRLVEFFSNAASYPEKPVSVRVVETHISWVFLTDRFAYKLKKPVRFEFLDFSTPELRSRVCQEELRLNRRLAPDVYLDVVPVTQAADGALRLGDGGGCEVDWVVQMRRLPANRALDVMLRAGTLAPDLAQAIAEYLVAFYARQPPVAMNAGNYRRALERHIRANGEALSNGQAVEPSRIARIQSAQLRYLWIEADLVGRRATEEHVVDGHGDLRPEHIYLDHTPAVIDCLEFSAELRTVDIADELSFLAMECKRLGDGGLGELVLKTYQQTCGDEIPPSLLAFYRAYRACVRAKVALLREQQIASGRRAHSNDVAQYIELAERDAAQLGPPVLLIVGGLMGTGKSTLAKRLAHSFDVEVLSTDQIRRALLGESELPADYGEGLYRPEMRQLVYDALFQRAADLLADGRSVILDGAFLNHRLRQRAIDLGRNAGAVPMYVLCTCPRAVALERIESRAQVSGSESEARQELYDRQARDFEPPDTGEPAMMVDTTQAAAQQLQRVFAELRRRLFA